jgi:hypothetical protein
MMAFKIILRIKGKNNQLTNHKQYKVTVFYLFIKIFKHFINVI